ncbi:MAG TPA: O-antigen ligase family protein [Solirubrobacterales bacterium]|nr:O-antigen ligase family protein [Solirubrobacterales bacterium]
MQGRGEEQQGTQQVRELEASPFDHAAKDSHGPLGEGAAAEAIEAAPLLLAALLTVVAIWWDGAFDMRYWAPLTLLSLALLLALVLAGTIALPRRGALGLAVGAIWAFAAYTMLSAAWSESPNAAWEGAALAIFYAALFTLAVATPAAGRGRAWIGAGLVLGVVATGLISEVRLLAGDTGAFLAGRLNDPIGYRNGTAALFAFAAWPLVGFAAERGRASGFRAAAFAAAVLSIGLAFLTQSRGMLIGVACGGIVSLAIGPDRVRRAWLALAVIAVVTVGSGALLAPYDGSGSGTGAAAAADIRHAGIALALLCAGSFLAGLFAFVFDNGLRSPELSRGLRTAAAGGLILIVSALAVGGLARAGNPVNYAEGKWDEFTEVEASAASGTRLGTVSGPRYDIWHVAVDQFGEAPLVGAGEGSFRFAYYRERQTDRNLADAHSLPLRLLAETGLVGTGLFALWLIALGVAVAGRTRLAGPTERTAVAGLAAAGTVVVAQSSVDWLWLIPALFGLAVLALGLAATTNPTCIEAQIGPRCRSGLAEQAEQWRLAPRALAGIVLFAAIVSVGALFLSGVYVRKAREQALVSPSASLASARTAAQLDPVSVTPLYLQAAALESEGRRNVAREKLLDALDLEQGNFVTFGLLGDLEVRAGNEARARGYYRRALALNPLDTGLRKLSRGEES